MQSDPAVSSCFVCVLTEVKPLKIARTYFLHHLPFKVVCLQPKRVNYYF